MASLPSLDLWTNWASMSKTRPATVISEGRWNCTRNQLVILPEQTEASTVYGDMQLAPAVHHAESSRAIGELDGFEIDRDAVAKVDGRLAPARRAGGIVCLQASPVIRPPAALV